MSLKPVSYTHLICSRLLTDPALHLQVRTCIDVSKASFSARTHSPVDSFMKSCDLRFCSFLSINAFDHCTVYRIYRKIIHFTVIFLSLIHISPEVASTDHNTNLCSFFRNRTDLFCNSNNRCLVKSFFFGSGKRSCL